MTNSEWQESENSKNDQSFENHAFFGDLAAILKMNNFFQWIFKHNPYESRDSVYFRKSAKKSTISNRNP